MAWDQVDTQLNELFAQPTQLGYSRRIVFWYDGTADSAQDVAGLTLGNAQVVLLQQGKGAFALKCRMEEEAQTNFLVYAPFDKPDPDHNWLQDVQEYSEEFAADRPALELRELNLYSSELIPAARKYAKFLGNRDRVEKLRRFALVNPGEKGFVLAVHAVLCGCTALTEEAIAIALLADWAAGSDRCRTAIERFGDWKELWKLLCEYYRMQPDLGAGNEDRDFALRAFASSLHLQLGSFAESLRTYIAGNRVSLFTLLDTMRGVKADSFRALSDKVSQYFDILALLRNTEPNQYAACWLFKAVDETLIAVMAGRLARNGGGTEADREVLSERRNNNSPWAEEFRNEYGALNEACAFISKYSILPDGRLPQLLEVEDVQKRYAEDWYQFDQHYRRFVSYNQAADCEPIQELANRMEYLYVDKYLPELSSMWDGVVLSHLQQGLPWGGHNPQWRFFERDVRRYVSSGARLIVIISDALRYEVSRELAESLGHQYRDAEIELDYMTSVVPSVTHFGMAALLPGAKRSWRDVKAISVDGLPTAGTENRDAVLKRVSADAVALTWSQLRNASRDEYRALISNKKLVYIYHDAIDAVGESPATAYNVPEECTQAVDDLSRLVKNLFNYVSAAHIVITADHGFIYQNKSLQEYDRIPASQSDAQEGGYRYIMSHRKVEEPGWHTVPMDYLLSEGGYYTNIPLGVQRIAKQGAPRQYTHGGITLQETVIPLLWLSKSTSPSAQLRQTVNVDLSGSQTTIRNRFFRLNFLQMESVNEVRLPRYLRLVFEDGRGKVISNEVQYRADVKEESVERRRFSLQFTLKDASYSAAESYFLVMRDVIEKDGTEIISEYRRVPFAIQLLIADEF